MKFSAEIIAERFRTVQRWAEEAFDFARELDWLGDANQHPEGSEHRELAQVRDDVDHELSRCICNLKALRSRRAKATRSSDLLIDVVSERMGDGPSALQLMDRYHALFGDGTGPNGVADSDTFPDDFAWDTYQRVHLLAKLAEQYPKHIRHGARQMNGWPMIVSHHLDGRHEFERMAELLQLGADYPMAVGPRKRRGTETPMMRYLDPLVWRLYTLRTDLIRSEDAQGREDFSARLRLFWWDSGEKPSTPEVVAILKLVPALPPLTQKAAREWSRKVIVPYILIEDAGTQETCKIPVLRNIWRHQSVKSQATFRSRLHSAVTDTLQRFGRPEK
jgi:hypothetical protein